MKKQFLKYQELNEALKLSQYREYHDIRPKDLENKLSEIFKGLNRIYIPFEYKVTDKDIDENINIMSVLDESGYTVTNYLEGYCEKDGRTFRIGKILNKLNRLDLLKTFNEDPNRAVQNKDFLICISKHPYDIAGMSTDRGWTSCMDISKSHMDSYIEYEIKEGTVIAYLIEANDKNINHPYGRINIKPYKNENGDMAWGLASKCYGSLLFDTGNFQEKFKNEVQDWVDLNMKTEIDDIYHIRPSVYKEADRQIYVGEKETKKHKIFKWGLLIEKKYKKGVYNGYLKAPKDIKEFNGFEKELGLDIKEVKGDLNFRECESLTSISNLPEIIEGDLSFSWCTSLTSISKLPSIVDGYISTTHCPFFKGMDEEQIREKYGIKTKFDDVRKRYGVDIKNLTVDHYEGTIVIPYDLKKFTNFKDELNMDINTIKGNLSFFRCEELTSISKIPYYINGDLIIYKCHNLKKIESLPNVVTGNIYVADTPFFKTELEAQIRKKYKIKKSLL